MTRILFIEDDEVLAILVRDGLSMLGFEVICRYRLDEILTELESLKPDVLLLDLDIQGESSESLLPKIRILLPKTNGKSTAENCMSIFRMNCCDVKTGRNKERLSVT